MEPPPRPPLALPEELVEEILLCFPPDDPASLVRAALVCRPWCRLIAGLGFRRRFRQFHRTPPMLGFLRNSGDEDWFHFGREFVRFVPTSSFRPPRADWSNWCAIDARHGRILLQGRWNGYGFAIWDPITDERVELPTIQRCLNSLVRAGAVLCAGGDACDHLDCHGGPFQVVVISADHEKFHAYVYSSEVGVWSYPTTHLQYPEDDFYLDVPSALVENALYFALGSETAILMYDLSTQEMSMIDPPVSFDEERIVLTTMDTGRLGFAIVKDSKFYLWSRETGHKGDAGWIRTRVIELNKLPCISPSSGPLDVAGHAIGIDVFLMVTDDGLFTIDLKSSEVKKACNISGSPIIFPYMSFNLPALGGASAGAGPRADVSSA